MLSGLSTTFPRTRFRVHHLSSILFVDSMVPNIEKDYILLLGYSILHKEDYLTGLSHPKKTLLTYLVDGGDLLPPYAPLSSAGGSVAPKPST